MPRKFIPLVAVSLALLLMATGCADSPTARSSGDAGRLTTDQVRSLVGEARRFPRGIEDSFLEADERTGGFGGFFVDSSGVPFVWETTAALAFDLSEQLPTAIRNVIGTSRLQTARRLIARYRFTELVAYQIVSIKVLSDVSSLVAVDADERLNRLRVELSDFRDAAAVLAKLSEAGVPTDAVVLTRGYHMHATATLQDKLRPTGGGAQIRINNTFFNGSYAPACSLGFNVVGVSNGQRYALSNSHCTSDFDGEVGSTAYQRNVDNRDVIGSVEVNPAWNVTDPLCGDVARCRYSDAALVRYTLAANNTPDRVIYPCSYSANPGVPGTIGTCGQSATVDDAATVLPWVGQPLQKVGRTTGWTVGLVTATCLYQPTLYLEAGNPNYFSGILLCSDRVAANAGGGDSGAPVFYHPTLIGAAVVAPMGVLFGVAGSLVPPNEKYYAFSRRQLIEAELGALIF